MQGNIGLAKAEVVSADRKLLTDILQLLTITTCQQVGEELTQSYASLNVRH